MGNKMKESNANKFLKKVTGEISQQSCSEEQADKALFEFMKELTPQFGNEWNIHNLVTMKRQTLSRILYYNDLYKKILNIPGVICEFGVHWGSTITQLANLRGIYEPYNHSRKIIGFDTFEGFADVSSEDGCYSAIGDYSTTKGYENTLETLLAVHESLSPIPHLKKYELVKGDASLTIDKWLDANPHAIISMAIFDMDIYAPTKTVLEKVVPRLTKGSLLVFDELNCVHFPGETMALDEVLKLNNLSLRRHPNQPYGAWAVFGE